MKKYIGGFLVIITLLVACKKENDEITPSGTSLVIKDSVIMDSAVVHYSRLIFNVKTFNSNNGNLLAAIFNSSANYTNNVRFKSYVSPLASNNLVIRFDSIPSGTYCMSCFHDANGNNSLDKNFFGAPTEGYGFSNNPGISFGAPSFNQLKFIVDSLDSMNFNIDLIYL